MKEDLRKLIIKLNEEHSLKTEEYALLISGYDKELAAFAAELAVNERKKYYSNDVYIRGLIEIGNVCGNDCYYCGIRRSNKNCDRYVLSEDEILSCCEEGYPIGFRTFVLQGGEGVMKADKICAVVSKIKKSFPDCAVTLSLGEYSFEDYKRMFEAGADRYLLRHETADKAHYEMLHPKEMSFENRMRCLEDLKRIGFQVGCGFMVGSPYQTADTLAQDFKFIEEFSPHMCGIGPFIPQKDTPFGKHSAGSAELTLYLLSLIRLLKPNILLPATTALGTLLKDGRERGILSGANVIMPNLSPVGARKKYLLYDNKLFSGEEAAEGKRMLEESMRKIGYEIVTSRGDINKKI